VINLGLAATGCGIEERGLMENFVYRLRASRWWVLCGAALLMALHGCAGFSPDGGFAGVAAATHSRLDKHIAWPRTEDEAAKSAAEVAQLLSHPLTADDAVQVALLNNHALRASFDDLQISEADLVQSGRLPNPRFDLTHASADGQYDIVESVSFNVLSLLTLPYAHGIEAQRFAQTQSSVFLDVAQLATATRKAYFEAVAAHQSLQYLQQVSTAAQTGAILAQRMRSAGNWNSIDQAREQIFYTDAAQSLIRAQLAEAAARENLLRLLGLGEEHDSVTPLQLGAKLPDLPPAIESLPDVERTVLQNRVDLQLMHQNMDALAHRLKLTKATRFINVLDAGPSWARQGARDAPYEHGYAVTLEIPIFDSGAARVKRSEALYAQAVDRFAQAAVEARSQVRQAYAAYQASFAIARQQRDEVVPLREAVARQNLLRYNASLISIFELLADTRGQIAGVDDYIASLRDFWLAKSRLDAALLGNPTP
jgi:outer membrane protein TolC